MGCQDNSLYIIQSHGISGKYPVCNILAWVVRTQPVLSVSWDFRTTACMLYIGMGCQENSLDIIS
jgi:hypothetical protein